MRIQGAAISLQGVYVAILVVDMALVNSSAQADMAMESISASFGDVPVVLMAQKEDGCPVYRGDEELVRSLPVVPLDKTP